MKFQSGDSSTRNNSAIFYAFQNSKVLASISRRHNHCSHMKFSDGPRNQGCGVASRSRRESEVFGWSRIHKNTSSRRRLISSDSDSGFPTESRLHRTPKFTPNLLFASAAYCQERAGCGCPNWRCHRVRETLGTPVVVPVIIKKFANQADLALL